MSNNDINGRNHRNEHTSGYQSTKLNKSRETRQRSQIKTDLAQTAGGARRTGNSGTSAHRAPAATGRERTQNRSGGNGRTKTTEAGRTRQRPPQQQTARERRLARERYRRRRRKVMMMQVTFLLVSVAILTGLALLVKRIISKDTVVESEAVVEEEIKNVLSDVTDDAVSVTKYFVYGTHLNIEGALSSEREIQTMELVLVDDAQGINDADTEGGTASDEMEKIYLLTKNINADGSYSFRTSENINEGVNLENISDGNYCMLLKVIYADGGREYKSLTDTSGESAITYYTLTKNKSNQKIQISFAQDSKGTNLNYLEMNVAESALPEDVYDIVIDAGHGGKDTGASHGSYTEAELTLQYAKALKESLEDMGYKIKLTRDGSESSDENMAYTMYDEDGRVSVACRSGAKYCLCLHLNSNEEKLTKGGVQIYCSIRGNGDFAKLVADGIVTEAGTDYSRMESDRVMEGVYASPYSEKGISKNVATAQKYGFEPYSYEGVDSLFMIRELGGIATGAFVDGRDTRYGSNEYRNSNIGVETLLIELGYISIDEDLQNIISNQKGYVKGITEAVEEQIQNGKTS